MKTKRILSMLVLLLWATLLSAQITREQADEIVNKYVQSVETRFYILRVNINAPCNEGVTITTFSGETIRAKYACWVYFVDIPYLSSPFQGRYLFVRESDGNLLEVISNNDFGPRGDEWTFVEVTSGIAVQKDNNKLLYPNPVDDWLTIPYASENARIEIYDLKGTRLFSGLLTSEDTCRLNVSFLSAGVYLVNVSGETYKLIKK